MLGLVGGASRALPSPPPQVGGPAFWRGCPKCPKLGVTSATSWCSVTWDTVLVLVTQCPLGLEPDFACPCSYREEGAPGWTERPQPPSPGEVGLASFSAGA